MRAILVGLLVIASGCCHAPAMPDPIKIIETKEVEMPVAVRVKPPPELVAPYRPEQLPEFVAPNDPAASSALTPEGERRLRALISDLVTRDDAWRRWVEEESHEPPAK